MHITLGKSVAEHSWYVKKEGMGANGVQVPQCSATDVPRVMCADIRDSQRVTEL